MSWHYRVLRYDDGCLALHEVYCDEAGQPNRCTVKPVSFGADADEGLAGIIGGLEMALNDARARPVLDYAQFAKSDMPELTDEQPAQTQPLAEVLPDLAAAIRNKAAGRP